MPKHNKPNRGSMAFSPRKRARSETPHISSWAAVEGDDPKILGFAGYKVGMSHIMAVDYRKKSTTAGQEIRMPVTIVEIPPMKVIGARGYIQDTYGLRTLTEAWEKKIDKDLERTLPIPKGHNAKAAWKKMSDSDLEEVRLLVHTQPRMVTGIPKKRPEIMEMAVGGGSVDAQIEFAKEMMGKEFTMSDFTQDGEMLDAIAVTTGYGFQGHVKRWGVKLLTHKNSKHRRMIGNLGPFSPGYVVSTVPQAGQTGYHQRTEYNKRLLKIGDNPDEINPKGGFLNYGLIRGNYALLHGSLPGPSKRLIRFRKAVRFHGKKTDSVVVPEITMISQESQQGV
ncbi:MAG: 50S ribosomal protein L3 [Marine Group III euryarchaeote CG-Epi1]|jgi:large subunit ribosomal protein L3|uniref:Large ribosomal subunit protein uL3 n=1 Tax=Marine Group III euryarchaeote CG-Epi1 TaxID=1888995 RepID=A0A1J5TBJ8_9ARCH|nr:MAG: 50S ribosomal protein L3 [Marine Group III euryarchaeote CG-Epi1]|tara:strand:- start:1322 stop:2332 length:1011 start_codon:yes stop_codon:yes gene_type:complete